MVAIEIAHVLLDTPFTRGEGAGVASALLVIGQMRGAEDATETKLPRGCVLERTGFELGTLLRDGYTLGCAGDL